MKRLYGHENPSDYRHAGPGPWRPRGSAGRYASDRRFAHHRPGLMGQKRGIRKEAYPVTSRLIDILSSRFVAIGAHIDAIPSAQ